MKSKTNRLNIKWGLKTCIISFSLLIMPLTAFGNLAQTEYVYFADICGDIGLGNISVLKEDLSIKIIRMGFMAEINARYEIDLPPDIQKLNPVFVANNLIEDSHTIRMDGKKIKGEIEGFDTIPEEWLPPDSIVYNNKFIPYHYNTQGLISFAIDSIEPGRHLLEVSYIAKTSKSYSKGDLAFTSSLVYILKPDSTRKSFKNFNLEVVLPQDWDYSSNIKLKQQGNNTLTCNFEDLPAHHLALAFKPKEHKAIIFSWIFIVLSTLLGLILIFKWVKYIVQIRAKSRYRHSILITNLLSTSLTASVITFFIVYFQTEIKGYFLEWQLSIQYEYLVAAIVPLYPIIFVLYLILVSIVDARLTKKMCHEVQLKEKRLRLIVCIASSLLITLLYLINSI